MNKILLTLIILYLSNSVFPQKVFYQPMIVTSSSGNTVVKKNGKEIGVESLIVCNFNERIDIVKGEIRLFDGKNDEFELNEGEHFYIKRGQATEEIEVVNKISRFINEPSVYLPNLYNDQRSHVFVFPIESKVYNQENIKLYFHKKFKSEMILKFFYNRDSLIWQTKIPQNETFPSDIKLLANHKYFWKLYAGSIVINGQFEKFQEKELGDVDKDILKTKLGFLNTFFKYLENDCKFDALVILSQARKKFPNCMIIKNLIKTIQIEVED